MPSRAALRNVAYGTFERSIYFRSTAAFRGKPDIERT